MIEHTTSDLPSPVRAESKRPQLRAYTVLRCRAGGRHHVGWCYMMCKPVDGKGLCGRQAPHAVDNTHRKAIRAFNERRAREAAERRDN